MGKPGQGAATSSGPSLNRFYMGYKIFSERRCNTSDEIGDTEGSLLHDHKFRPRLNEIGVEGLGRNSEWAFVRLPPNQYLCTHCGLAEAAHAEKEEEV